MFSKSLTALVAASLVAAPALAAPRTAPKPTAEKIAGGNALFDEWGTEAYLIAAVLTGLAVWGLIELSREGDQTASPD